MSKYKCPACKKTMDRDDSRPTHLSYCASKQKKVIMKKVKK